MKTKIAAVLWAMLSISLLAKAQTKIPTSNTQKTLISFVPTFNKKPLQTNKWYVTAQNDSVKIELVKLYISNIRLYFNNGEVFNEPNSYHLLDTDQPNSFNIALHNVPAHKISHIGFSLGIDSLANTAGALEGDLDPSKGMYWAWQSGYINLKIEGISPSCNTRKHAFEFHIGGFLPPNNALRTTKLKVKKHRQNTLTINMDLARFFNTIDLHTFNSIMIPGKDAMQTADKAIKIFLAR